MHTHRGRNKIIGLIGGDDYGLIDGQNQQLVVSSLHSGHIIAPSFRENPHTIVRLTAAQISPANERAGHRVYRAEAFCVRSSDWLPSAECGLMSGGCVSALAPANTLV